MGNSIAKFGFLVFTLTSPLLLSQYVLNPDHRRPVERTISDLALFEHQDVKTARQLSLYDRTLRDLHEFESGLRENGRFDRNKLDISLTDLQRILDDRPYLPVGDQETLRRDLRELRREREHPDDSYKYPR